jgi:hypothetical protein
MLREKPGSFTSSASGVASGEPGLIRGRTATNESTLPIHEK